MISRPLYRTRQFLGALRSRVREGERAEARTLLGERLMPLFESMTPRDQRHSLDVYSRLRSSGCADAALLTAALLHDSGKGSLSGTHVRLWHRVAYVLLEDLATGRLKRLAGRPGAMAVLHHHADLGAALAESMGAASVVVDLIRRHGDEDAHDETLLMLREADGDS